MMEGAKITIRKTTSSAKNAGAVNQRRLQKSTTLNRKFVKKPVPQPRIKASAGAASRTLKAQSQKRVLISKGQAVKLAPIEQKAEKKVEEKVVQEAPKELSEQELAQQKLNSHVNSTAISFKEIAKMSPANDDEPIEPVRSNAIAERAKAKMAARKAAKAPVQHKTAQELKEQAIQRAMQRVAMMGDAEEQYDNKSCKKHFWQRKHFAAAASMAVISIALLGYLIGVNMPDISVRVAAMHTGIEKAYPSYVPAGYRLDGLVKEDDGRITMSFKNSQDQKFNLMEEKSSWDSSAVLTNYVSKNWGASYSIAKGQGLTIYISGSNAAWVNGGVFYVITDDSNSLSSSDLHDIAVSL